MVIIITIILLNIIIGKTGDANHTANDTNNNDNINTDNNADNDDKDNNYLLATATAADLSSPTSRVFEYSMQVTVKRIPKDFEGFRMISR